MYVKGTVDGYIDQLGETVIVGDDFLDGETKEFAGLKSMYLCMQYIIHNKLKCNKCTVEPLL